MAVILSAVIVASLAGCSVTSNTAEPKKSSPATTEAKEASCVGSTVDYGDVIPLEEVTDEFGTYCHVTINPKAKAFTMYEDVIDTASFTEQVIEIAEAKKALDSAIVWAAEQNTDSTLLDNYTSESEWFAAVGADNVSDVWVESYQTMAKEQTLSSSGLIFTKFGASPLRRDGTPRAENMSIIPTSIVARQSDKSESGAIIIVTFDIVGKFPASDKSLLEATVRNSGKEESELTTIAPELSDGVESQQVLTQTISLAYDANGSYDKLTGSNFSLGLKTGTGFDILAGNFP